MMNEEYYFDTNIVLKTEIKACSEKIEYVLYNLLSLYQYYLIIDDRLIHRVNQDLKMKSYFSVNLNDFTIPVLLLKENFEILKMGEEKIGIIIVRQRSCVDCMFFTKNKDSLLLRDFETVKFAGEIKDIFDADIIYEKVNRFEGIYNNDSLPQKRTITFEELFGGSEIITIKNDYVIGYDITRYLLSK